MRKGILFSLFSFFTYSLFGSGHGLGAAIEYYFIEFAVLYFLLPWLFLTILSLIYKKVKSFKLMILIIVGMLAVCTINVYFFIEFREMLDGDRAGPVYIIWLLVFLFTFGINLYLLYSGYKKYKK